MYINDKQISSKNWSKKPDAILTHPASKFGGETGIRTQGRVAPTTVFETATFGLSVISPETLILRNYNIEEIMRARSFIIRLQLARKKNAKSALYHGPKEISRHVQQHFSQLLGSPLGCLLCGLGAAGAGGLMHPIAVGLWTGGILGTGAGCGPCKLLIRLHPSLKWFYSVFCITYWII